MKEITIVWLSKKAARILTVTPGDVVQTSSFSCAEVESSTVPSQNKSQVKKNYFDYIVQELKEPREVVLFGPDNTKEEFLDYLCDAAPHLFNKVVGVESSQDMPEEKIIARGRKYI